MTTNNPTQQVSQNAAHHGFVGLYLLFGIVLILIGLWAFYSIGEDIIEKDAIVQFDDALENYIHQSVSPQTGQLMYIISIFGNEVVTVSAIVLGIYFALRRYWRNFLLMLIGVGGAEILIPLIKSVVQRGRPVLENPFQVINNFSFPSGHAFFSVVFYGLLAFMLFETIKSSGWRIAIILVMFAIILLIGLSRVYLGVHFVSDVLAGYMGGLAWLAFTTTGIEFLHRYREYRRARRV